MVRWNDVAQGQRDAVAAAFEQRSISADLAQHVFDQEGLKRRLGFDDLYKFFNGNMHIDAVDLERALGANARLMQSYEKLLNKHSLYHLPRAAAAASGELEERVGDGFSIRVKPSLSKPDQIYMLIELADPDESSATKLVLKSSQGKYHHEILPEGADGVVQLVTDSGSDLMRYFQDPGSEVFLI